MSLWYAPSISSSKIPPQISCPPNIRWSCFKMSIVFH
jgi:hypothetical protein